VRMKSRVTAPYAGCALLNWYARSIPHIRDKISQSAK